MYYLCILSRSVTCDNNGLCYHGAPDTWVGAPPNMTLRFARFQRYLGLYPRYHQSNETQRVRGAFTWSLLFACCSRQDYCLQGLQFGTLGGGLERLPDSLGDLFSPVAFTICLQWLLVQVLLDRVLPGKVSKTPPKTCHQCASPGTSDASGCLNRNTTGRIRKRADC